VATLVFSTVGTALGGPIGGAIGALIGQSIDQQILAPSARGPRLGDLSVQSSSYGTQIPRVYGTVRVAGCVVWSTDLEKSSQTTGAKGQPDATYSYRVSFAVALSSRRSVSVGRIWADGKLLRGAAGDFKVPVTFRFYGGSEDQPIDPLIGSIEGIGNTPAYRGLALAVFENLELAEYGNRIPFLTFELVADTAAPTIGNVLEDSSAGAIACSDARTLVGYAAYGRSIAAAAEPLVSSHAVELFDDGMIVRSPVVIDPIAIGLDELGNSADGETEPRIRREQSPARALPAALRLAYYDPARDYQSGVARASAGQETGNEEERELPAVLTAGDAKALAQQMLARAWAERDTLILRMPPRRIAVEPGSRVDLPLTPARWTITKCTTDGLVAVAELHPTWNVSAALAADAGRVLANSDVVAGEATLALLDVPDVLGQSLAGPALLLAASTSAAGWRARPVTVTYGGKTILLQTARRKSVLGHSLTELGPGERWLIDGQSSVDIGLVDPDQWLTSCDDDELAAGTNLAVLGSELIQFGSATPLGSGRFRLERLLRGRGGTEWASTGHAAGDTFVLIERDALQPIGVPAWTIGARVAATCGSSACEVVLSGESLRGPSPVGLRAEWLAGGDLGLSWTRRSRQGWAWIDEIEAPLGEAREQYRVTLTGSAGTTIECEVEQPLVTISAASLAIAGPGPALVEVRQIGDLAATRPTQLTVTIP
jgi:hypothetical protein